jgi:hypothetical protein
VKLEVAFAKVGTSVCELTHWAQPGLLIALGFAQARIFCAATLPWLSSGSWAPNGSLQKYKANTAPV